MKIFEILLSVLEKKIVRFQLLCEYGKGRGRICGVVPYKTIYCNVVGERSFIKIKTSCVFDIKPAIQNHHNFYFLGFHFLGHISLANDVNFMWFV